MPDTFFQEHLLVLNETKKQTNKISEIAELLSLRLSNGHKLLICGNGGSAADAQHFAAELVSKYKKERIALPAIALTTDTSILTAIGNDYSFDDVFARQIEAHCKKNDLLVIISTSGNSKNILNAARKAKDIGATVIGLLGKGGGAVRPLCDLELTIASVNTPRIQEAHILIIHIICELIERRL